MGWDTQVISSPQALQLLCLPALLTLPGTIFPQNWTGTASCWDISLHPDGITLQLTCRDGPVGGEQPSGSGSALLLMPAHAPSIGTMLPAVSVPLQVQVG